MIGSTAEFENISRLIETHFNSKYLLKGLKILDLNVEFKINYHHFTLQWLGI